MYSKFTGGGNSGTWHKELLRDNHEFLMENMQVKDNKLLDILFGDRIIDEDVDEKVRQLPTNCDQTRQLLKELRKGRSKNYNGLLRALKKTGQHDVANELEMRRQEHMDGGSEAEEDITPGAHAAGNSALPTLGELMATLKPQVGKSGLSGVASAGDCICVSGNNKPHIWLYNLKTKKEQQHKLSNLEAVGITAFSSGSDDCAFVISSGNKRLYLVNIHPQTLAVKDHKIYNISYEPGCISMVQGEQLLVVVNRTDEKIVVCDFDKVKKCVNPKEDFTDMKCALTNNAEKNEFVILDSGDPGRIIWVDKAGNDLHTYGSSERDKNRPEYLNNPYAIVQDRTGRLIVADTTHHRLHLIGSDKEWSGYLLTREDGISLPEFLCLDENKGQLIVAYGVSPQQSRIRVYKWNL